MIDSPEFNSLRPFDVKEDLYVTSTGFEDRNLGGTKELMKNNFKTKDTLVIKYDNYIEENEKDLDHLERIWKDFSDDVHHVVYPTNDRNLGIKNLENFLSSLNLDNSNITINISSFKTHVLVWVVNYLFDHCNRVRIIYTEPEGYGNQLESKRGFSSGVGEIFTMPEFSGAVLPGYSTLLIILLGYDFIRSRGIYDQIQPSKKIGIIAEPNTKTLERHYPILNSNHQDSFSHEDKKKSFSIFAIKNLIDFLSQVRHENIETCNISLALNGSKLHTLAGIIFAKKFQDIQLIVSTPLTYYPENYSFGVGRTFQIEISKSWLDEILKEFS